MSELSINGQDLFRVVFLNEFKKGMNVDEIQQNVTKKFRLSEQGTARMFAKRPIVVKKNVNVETAYQLKLIFDETGALCKIDMMPEVDDTDPLGYLERRKNKRRKQKNRRSRMRSEHIIPDRREIDRRVNPCH